MRDIILNYTCLAPIFLLDKSLEPIPEPFRMQDSVAFTVPFSEYKTFIEKSLKEKDYLVTPTSYLKRFESTNDIENLFRCYLKDMAVAVCKELHYAELFSKEATLIGHSCNGDTILSFKTITNEHVKDASEIELRAYMESRDFKLPKLWEQNNRPLFCYACRLWRESKEVISFWEVDYDSRRFIS